MTNHRIIEVSQIHEYEKLDLLVIITRYFTKAHIRYSFTYTNFSHVKSMWA